MEPHPHRYPRGGWNRRANGWGMVAAVALVVIAMVVGLTVLWASGDDSPLRRAPMTSAERAVAERFVRAMLVHRDCLAAARTMVDRRLIFRCRHGSTDVLFPGEGATHRLVEGSGAVVPGCRADSRAAPTLSDFGIEVDCLAYRTVAGDRSGQIAVAATTTDRGSKVVAWTWTSDLPCDPDCADLRRRAVSPAPPRPPTRIDASGLETARAFARALYFEGSCTSAREHAVAGLGLPCRPYFWLGPYLVPDLTVVSPGCSLAAPYVRHGARQLETDDTCVALLLVRETTTGIETRPMRLYLVQQSGSWKVSDMIGGRSEVCRTGCDGLWARRLQPPVPGP